MPDWNPQANDLFLRAAEIDAPVDRAAFLDRECADPGVRAQVESLLAAGDKVGSFMERPASATGVYEPNVEGVGSQIGPYKLLQQIGEGGMGTVFMAEQTAPVRRTVALKVIKPGMASAQVIARFAAERQALALMDHPNIAKVLDAGTTTSGCPYFVMELVKGVPITRFCDDHQLTPRQRLELFVPVCQAVQHAHTKGVIHRDLKPSNVLVALYDDRPVPKVIDFGVAKATGERLTDRTLFTAFGSFVGTLEYMSPEQAKLNALDIDTRSDVYALGVLLYELLTGGTPLERGRLRQAALDELLRIIREEEPQKPSTRLSQSGEALAGISACRHTEPARLSKLLRGELDWIVMKALEKDRTRRYETANGLARDLQRYLSDEPVEACPPSATYRLRKLVRRYKRPMAAAAAVLALVAVGAAVSIFQAVRAREAERAALQAHAAAVQERQRAVDKEAAAVQEADKARALAAMTQELLGAADPTAAKGGDYTVRQLVDDVQSGLGGRLAGQPEVEADLRTTIGQAYRYLMLNDKAEQQHRRSLELRRQVYGPDHPKVAQSLTQLAWSVRFQNNFPAAEKLAREAVAILRRAGDRDEDLAAALRILSHTTQGKRPAEGEAQLREALALAEKAAGGRPSAMVANIGHELASHLVIHFEGRAAEALPLATRSVAAHLTVHGDRHPETMHGYRVLSFCHRALGQLPEAERALADALAVCLRAYGNQPHQFAVRTLADYVAVLGRQFKDEAADAAVKECLAAWRKPDFSFPDGETVLGARAIAALDRGDYPAAVRWFRQALDARPKAATSALDPMTVSLRFAVGATLFIDGKQDEARAALQPLVLPARLAAVKDTLSAEVQTAFAVALAVGGSGSADDLRAARTLAERAAARAARGNTAQRPMALWAAAVTDRRAGHPDRAVAPLRETLAAVRLIGRPGMALALFQRREAEALLVECLVETGDRAAAEAVLRDGLRSLESTLPAGDPEVAAAQANLATFLIGEKRHADAEPLLRAAHDALKAHPQAAAAELSRRRAAVVARLADVADAQGKPAEAAKWRAEATEARSGSPR